MVAAIGSMTSNIFSYNSSLFGSGQTSQALNFDDMVSSGIISNTENNEDSTGITSMGSSSSSSSSSTNSEMDLNKDGQVTSDEVIKYMQMQMMDRMSEQMSSEDGASEMSKQSQQEFNTGVEAFKNKQAAGAYQSVQNSVVDMITDCFMV